MEIDVNLRFGPQVGNGKRLERFLRNAGWPAEKKKKSLAGVIQLKMLYAAPLCAEDMGKDVHKWTKENNCLSDNCTVLKIVSVYHTVSQSVTLDLVDTPTIYLLVRERKEFIFYIVFFFGKKIHIVPKSVWKDFGVTERNS